MNLDQQTIEKPKTLEELQNELRQAEALLRVEREDKEKQISQFGRAGVDVDGNIKTLEGNIEEIKTTIGKLENVNIDVPEVQTAAKIVENKFNEVESTSDVEKQNEYHDKLIKKAEALNLDYTNKKSEKEAELKKLTAGTPEYIVTENLIVQYDKQIASSQMSIDSNKAAKKRLEKTA